MYEIIIYFLILYGIYKIYDNSSSEIDKKFFGWAIFLYVLFGFYLIGDNASEIECVIIDMVGTTKCY